MKYQSDTLLSCLFTCSVFEAERPGCRFTVQQRIGTYFYKVENVTLSKVFTLILKI
jgi:hypothetical protein